MGAENYSFGRFLSGSVFGLLPIMVPYTVMGESAGKPGSPAFVIALTIEILTVIASLVVSAVMAKHHVTSKHAWILTTNELIISSDGGIFLFNKKKEEDKEEIKVDIDIDDLLEKWKKYPFEYKKNLTNSVYVYDMIQINYKYLAGTINEYLCLISMETYEIITKFKVKISRNCDSIMFMLNDDILCLGGDDSITLISIKNFEILSETLIKSQQLITEICILPDFNILIGMKNYKDNKEYFYQYKYNYSYNKSKKKMEYYITKGTTKLLTKNNSNIMMRCLMEDRLATILDLKIIQIWEWLLRIVMNIYIFIFINRKMLKSSI